MPGDKRFDVVADDSMIVGDARYSGTSGLYELIFKRLPDDIMYTENDKQTYKSILLTTNAHQRGHNALMPVLGNKGFKYKHIITPLLLDRDKIGAGMARKRGIDSIPSAMRVVFTTGSWSSPAVTHTLPSYSGARAMLNAISPVVL
ncbi:hypothetical protein P5V15_015327 [Pogonomyrmex californicus]